jgi:DNA-binding NarL/FixJ family response regulator
MCNQNAMKAHPFILKYLCKVIQLLLVEDHSLVREGIKAMLATEKDIHCAGTSGTRENLLDRLKTFQPDLIAMDINLPDANGIELCKEVKDAYPQIYILALTINNQPAIVRKMMDNGASGYVLKDAAQHEIIEAIRTVAQGKEYFSQSVKRLLRKPDNATLPPLTRREKEILDKIANGLTNQQIAYSLSVDISTVSSHRKNMLAKYGVSNTAALVKLAITEKLI